MIDSGNSHNRFDTVIYNAHLVFGDNRQPIRGMVAINGEKIAYAGPEIVFESVGSIDAGGQVVCPGFIDIHGHSDFSILLYPCAESKIYQGVTTEVTGNCGLSAAPLFGQAFERWRSRYAAKGLDISWHNHDDYFTRLRQQGTMCNIAPLLGHTNLRTSVKDYSGDSLTENEYNRIDELVDASFDAGCWGVSFGLAYPPGIFADEHEIIHIMDKVQKRGGYTSVHIRDEGPRVEESIEEVLKCARESGCSLQISHLKSYGKKNWHKLIQVVLMIDAAAQTGLDITFDRYPYCAFNTDLDALLPQHLFEGGHEQAAKRLQDSAVRRKTVGYLKSVYTADDADHIVIADIAASHAQLIGEKLSEIIDSAAPDFWVQYIDLLLAIEFTAEATFELMSEDNLKTVLTHPACMVGSDSGVRSYSDSSKPHPRTYGTFPQFLYTALHEQLMPLNEAIYKMTGFPAQKIGLTDRGIIREGWHADLVMINPDELTGLPTYDNPAQKVPAIKAVWVNGQRVVPENTNKNLPGKLLLRR